MTGHFLMHMWRTVSHLVERSVIVRKPSDPRNPLANTD